MDNNTYKQHAFIFSKEAPSQGHHHISMSWVSKKFAALAAVFWGLLSL